MKIEWDGKADREMWSGTAFTTRRHWNVLSLSKYFFLFLLHTYIYVFSPQKVRQKINGLRFSERNCRIPSFRFFAGTPPFVAKKEVRREKLLSSWWRMYLVKSLIYFSGWLDVTLISLENRHPKLYFRLTLVAAYENIFQIISTPTGEKLKDKQMYKLAGWGYLFMQVVKWPTRDSFLSS